MFCRLRLRLRLRLRRLEIHRRCFSPATILTTSPKPSSSLSPSSLLATGGISRRRALSHQTSRHQQGSPCSRAAGTVTEEEEVTSAAAGDPSPDLYLSVRIRCSKHDAIPLSEALLCFGASSASMDDISDLEDSDETCITSIFADSQDVHTFISHAADSIGLNYVPTYEVSSVEQCDWVTNVQETFHPVEVTDGLWIVPEWRSPVVWFDPNYLSEDLQATNIILNPGMAFGTGEHPTTKLCLLLLHGLMRGGECFLDYGTGSGVLGIAAVKMGAALSVGIDIDPLAVTSARQNIALNGIRPDRMLVYLVSSSSDLDLNAKREKFEIVIANILLNPLLELAEDIVAYGKPGAVIGVSGILSEQVGQVRELYSRYLDDISTSEMDGWACLYGTKKDVLLELGRK